MSDIQKRVTTIFDARGSERVRAALGTMQSGFGSYRREIDMGSRSTSYLNNQMRALGTTIRYAFAGTAIFGTLAMVKNLGDFQAKLGEIQAIASGPGGLPLLDSQIDDLGQRLIDVSNKTTQPISDLQAGVLSLYSTIGEVPPNEAANLMETISNVAITSQSNIEDTTQALLGMINAFGKGTDSVKTYGDEFFRVIKLSAGMPGHVYAQQLGRLSASATLGGFTAEQMGALAVGATRFGGSPATNQRGLAQLMTFIMNPTTAKTQAAFASIGLGRGQRQALGGYGTLQAVLTAVNARGGGGNPRGLNDDMLSVLQEQYGENVPNQAVGLSGGPGGELLAKLFPRIEGRRIAAVLARLQTPAQTAGTKNQTLDQYLKDVTAGTDTVDKGMQRAMDYRRINQAANAMHNFGIEVGTAISPLLQYPARGIVAGSKAFNNQRWDIPGTGISGQSAEVAGGGIGIALLLRQLRRGGAGSGMIGRGARGLPFAAAGLDAISGDQQRGHSPLNPLYVAVVYSLANGFTGRGSMGIPNRDMRRDPGSLGGPGYAGTRGRRAPSRGRAWRVGGGIIGGVLASAGIDQVIESYLDTRGYSASAADAENTAAAKGNPLLKYLGIGHYNVFGQPTYSHKGTKAEHEIIDAYGNRKISAAEAEKRLRRIATPGQLAAAGINVKGKAEVTVTVQDTAGNKKGKAHVTTDLFPDFSVPAPQQKAKPVTRRGGN